jgi:hypothetical protein
LEILAFQLKNILHEDNELKVACGRVLTAYLKIKDGPQLKELQEKLFVDEKLDIINTVLLSFSLFFFWSEDRLFLIAHSLTSS